MPTDFSEMESLGEEAVRLKLSNLEWEGTQAKAAEHWLAISDSRKRDAREERTLSIASRANRLALIAIAIAAIAAAREIKWLINSITGWSQ